MKAKEYYKQYKKDIENGMSSEDALVKVVYGFDDDLLKLMNRRLGKDLKNVSIASLYSIINEIQQKWNALSKYDPVFVKDGFLKLIEKQKDFSFKEIIEIYNRTIIKQKKKK